MKNGIKKRIKSALEGTLFEEVSEELSKDLIKKVQRILMEEEYEYRNITVGIQYKGETDWAPIPYVVIYTSYGEYITIFLEWEGHNGQK